MVWIQGVIPLIGIQLMFLRITAQPVPRQYHFVNQSATWPEAQRYCREKYTDLATVDNMEDMNKLVKTLGSNIEYSWIGLERRGPGRWQWSDGIGGARFTNWNADEPNNIDGNEWCAEFSEEQTWNDCTCDIVESFVCYERRDNMIRYILYLGRMSWTESQDVCRSKHTDLVSVRTAGQNAVIGKLADGRKAWIGLFKDSWMWSDGSHTSFRYWQKGKPDNGEKKCALVLQQGRWDNSLCDRKAPFICHGGLKARKVVMKVTMSSDVDLTDSAISASLLQKLESALRSQQLSDIKLSWRSDEDGRIFQRKEEREDEGAKLTGG